MSVVVVTPRLRTMNFITAAATFALSVLIASCVDVPTHKQVMRRAGEQARTMVIPSDGALLAQEMGMGDVEDVHVMHDDAGFSALNSDSLRESDVVLEGLLVDLHEMHTELGRVGKHAQQKWFGNMGHFFKTMMDKAKVAKKWVHNKLEQLQGSTSTAAPTTTTTTSKADVAVAVAEAEADAEIDKEAADIIKHHISLLEHQASLSGIMEYREAIHGMLISLQKMKTEIERAHDRDHESRGASAVMQNSCSQAYKKARTLALIASRLVSRQHHVHTAKAGQDESENADDIVGSSSLHASKKVVESLLLTLHDMELQVDRVGAPTPIANDGHAALEMDSSKQSNGKFWDWVTKAVNKAKELAMTANKWLDSQGVQEAKKEETEKKETKKEETVTNTQHKAEEENADDLPGSLLEHQASRRTLQEYQATIESLLETLQKMQTNIDLMNSRTPEMGSVLNESIKKAKHLAAIANAWVHKRKSSALA